MTDVASRRPPTALPSFWLLHTSGWLAYGLAMALSRVGMFPLRYMVVVKGMLMVMGLIISLGLRYVYRPLIRRGTPLVALLALTGYLFESLIRKAVEELKQAKDERQAKEIRDRIDRELQALTGASRSRAR